MRVDLGPVDASSALAFVDYGWRVLDAAPGRELSGDVQQEFRRYLAQWTSAAQRGSDVRGAAIRWSYETTCDEVKYLLHAFHRLASDVEAQLPGGELPPFPAQAVQFYRALVRALLGAVATEATCATWAADLGSFWPGIDPLERWTHQAASGSR